ncbi:MAG: ribonuclease P protein component [Thiothrix sp.]|nr:ribonuclease P protein component [Thiothrix sp.]
MSLSGFPRHVRLTRPEEFQRLFERGRHRRTDVEGLLARSRTNAGACPRLGLAVSKRILKRSVDRNRIKRLVRESFRCHYNTLPNVDLVVLAKPELSSMDNAVILQQLGVLWQRLRASYPAGRDAPVTGQSR